MTAIPTTTTGNTSPAANSPGSWKWIASALAIILAIFIAAVGVESYYLYNALHPESLGAPPALTPTVPHPGTPIARSAQPPPILPGADDDWNLPFSPGSPWDQLGHLHQQMDQLFNDTLSQFPDSAELVATVSSPNLDVREEKDHYTVRADMPGADKGSIKVNVDGRVLSITGERSAVNETKENDKVVRTERSMAQFVRSIELPGPVKADAVDAKYDNGVLTVTLPKSDAAASGTQVQVQ
jgi:HSP20 family protein